MSRSNGNRQAGIDLLRAIAICMVVAFHFTVRFTPEEYLFEHPIAGFHYGLEGVYLFFIISGYCMAMTSRHSANWTVFLAKRLSRLEPALIACSIISFSIISLFGLSFRYEPRLFDIVSNAFWLPLFGNFPLVDGAYWSLLVEVRFYVLFAIIYFGLSRFIAPLVTFSIILSFSLVILLATMRGLPQRWSVSQYSQLVLDWSVFPYLPMFLSGICIYEAQHRTKIWAVALASLLSLTAIALSFNASELYLMLFLIVISVTLLPVRALYVPTAFVYIGWISYPLYLIHQNVGIVVIRETAIIVEAPYVRIGLAILVVVALASLVSVTVEHRYRGEIEQWICSPRAQLQRLRNLFGGVS